VPNFVICLLLITSVAPYAQDANAVAHAYAVQAAEIARRVLLSELVKHPERVHRISMAFSFQVHPQGRPRNVKIVSKIRNPWAADVAHRALSAARFPPIPKGADMANIHVDFDANTDDSR
jgi:hypothetical protein